MLGRNGCGKSTLLRTLAGLQPPLGGTFQLGNSNHQSREVAHVLSSDEATESTTVHDVVAMGRYPYTSLLGTLTPADEKVIEEALTAVGFEFRKSPFKTLSNSPLKGENSSLPLREGQGGSKSPFKGDLEGLEGTGGSGSRPRKLSYKEQRELEQLEQQMPQLEQEKAALEQQLSGGLTDPQAIAEASARYEQVQRALDEAELRWLELND